MWIVTEAERGLHFRDGLELGELGVRLGAVLHDTDISFAEQESENLNLVFPYSEEVKLRHRSFSPRYT